MRLLFGRISLLLNCLCHACWAWGQPWKNVGPWEDKKIFRSLNSTALLELFAVMKSWLLVSELILRPIFVSLCFGLEGIRSQSQRLQVSFIRTSLLSWDFEYFCDSMSFFTIVFPGKRYPKQVRKMPEIRKKTNLEVETTSLKNFSKMHKFWSLSNEVQVPSFQNLWWSLILKF